MERWRPPDKEDRLEYMLLRKRIEEVRSELIGAGYALEALARLMEIKKEAEVVRLISKNLDRAVAMLGGNFIEGKAEQ